MPNTTNFAFWDFSPTHAVSLNATFSFDTEDTQDNTPVSTALAAIQGRLADRNPNRSGDDLHRHHHLTQII